MDKLKEGWDVKNVYVIASMRASISKILTEQTLGRGLRLPFGRYTGVEFLDTLEVLAHESYDRLLKARNVFRETSIDHRTHAVVRTDDKGNSVVRTETATVQPLAATRRGFTRREPYPCPEVAPRAEALHRWRKGVDRHRRELSHPRDRHQAPERLVFPHDPTDLPVHLIDLRIQVVDPLDEEAYRGGYQHREELLTLRVRLFQPPDVVDPERNDESLRDIDADDAHHLVHGSLLSCPERTPCAFSSPGARWRPVWGASTPSQC